MAALLHPAGATCTGCYIRPVVPIHAILPMLRNSPIRTQLVQLVVFTAVFQLLAWAYYAASGQQMFLPALGGALGAWLGATWWQRRKRRSRGKD